MYRIKQMLLHFIWDLEHLWILVSAGVPGTNLPGIPKENCTCEKLEFKFRDKGFLINRDFTVNYPSGRK